jgi:hypothetical protein
MKRIVRSRAIQAIAHNLVVIATLYIHIDEISLFSKLRFLSTGCTTSIKDKVLALKGPFAPKRL